MTGNLTPSQIQQRIVRVVVSTPESSKKELRDIAKGLGDVNKAVSSINSATNILKGLWAAQLFGFGISELTGMADSMTLMAARATIFSKAGTDVNVVVSELIDLSREVRGPIDDISSAFSRIQLSTTDLNVSTEAQIALTETLAKSFKLSGATTAEAVNSMIQLGQAFQRGSLRGQELNSVLTQNAIVAKALKDSAREAGSDVRTLAEQGFFTNQRVFDILRKIAPEIEDQFSKLPPTFADIFSRLRTEVTVTAGKINSALGISSGIYNGLEYMLKVLPKIADVMVPLTAGVTGAALAFDLLAAAMGGTSVALTVLTGIAAKIALPFTALAGAIGVLGSLSLPILVTTVAVVGSLVAGISYLTSKSIELYGGFSDLTSLSKAMSLTWDNILNRSIVGISYALETLLLVGRATAAFFTAGISEVAFGDFFNGITDSLRRFREEANVKIDTNNIQKNLISIEALANKNFYENNAKKENSIFDQLTELYNNSKKYGNVKKEILSISEQIGRLNSEFAKTGNFDKYNSRIKVLEKLELAERLNKGQLALKKYNLELERLDLAEFQRKLEAGKASLLEFEVAANTFKIKELADKFDSAKISAIEFNQEILKLADKGTVDVLDPKIVEIFKRLNVEVGIFSKGIENASSKISYGFKSGLKQYEDGIMGLTESVASATTSVFSELEDTLLDSFSGQKDAFADFSRFIINEIQRIVIRLSIIKPLLESINATANSGNLFNLVGGLFSGGNTSPQLAGQTGLLTGSESGSNLGVSLLGTKGIQSISNNYSNSFDNTIQKANYDSQVIVNVTNNTPSEIKVTESTSSDGFKSIDIMVEAKVNKGIAEGKFDSSLRQSYGLQRRGQ